VAGLTAPEEPPDAFPLPAWAEPEAMLAEARETARERREMRAAVRDLSPAEAEQKRREFRQSIQRDQRQRGLEAQGWWLDRMLRSRAPLREKMTLFWHDHFATSMQKVRQAELMVQQNDLFRRHALGSFRELAGAVALDPAMALYLDTQTSKKGKPNENFAREVMELFTLGEGNYSEEDVREAARAFTGYAVERATGKLVHNKRQWDDGPKTVLGETGPWDGAGVIDILFRQDAAARYVPSKLWEFFVYEGPDGALVDALARAFRRAEFQVAPLLREVFLSQEFYSPRAVRTQIKSPVQFLVGLYKQLEIDRLPPAYARQAQEQLGQTLFLPPNVAGWDWGKAWINTNTLLARYNVAGFATTGVLPDAPGGAGRRARGAADAMEMEMEAANGEQMEAEGGGAEQPSPRPAVRERVRRAGASRLARGRKGPDYREIAPAELRDDPAALVDALAFRFFQGPVPDPARRSFLEYASTKTEGGLSDAEIGELCHLMLSTPYYQLT
jgi:uncharacterized protein (DUF1800 family)